MRHWHVGERTDRSVIQNSRYRDSVKLHVSREVT